ncbi:response regulator [Azoarcus sp. DN11]|uniref:response regulator transcription factor n=1 Tax=Azoarcus sp. DN11 TaxID=356837 RepID=UPI000EAB7A17|nr:response regulator [Azoarcus sp. DN11]AYH43273.1 DNA-binding response regulator [Azoarcus sp. DN11]
MSADQSVAIVDDDDFFRKALERVFHSAGFRTESFAAAEAFLASYIPKDEACIILDLRMPRLGGLELLDRLKERGIDVPVIIYTGNADVPVTVQAMQAGAYAVVEKPLSSELLITRVRAAITDARARRTRRNQSASARAKLKLLTEREIEVARHLTEGLSSPEMADLLGISPRTVDAHRANLLRKLEIRSIAALARLFVLTELGDS